MSNKQSEKGIVERFLGNRDVGLLGCLHSIMTICSALDQYIKNHKRLWCLKLAIMVGISAGSYGSATTAQLALTSAALEAQNIINNWTTLPLTSIVLAASSSTSCPAGYTSTPMGSASAGIMSWPGAAGVGCACQVAPGSPTPSPTFTFQAPSAFPTTSTAATTSYPTSTNTNTMPTSSFYTQYPTASPTLAPGGSTFAACTSNQLSQGCINSPTVKAVPLTSWRGRMICYRRDPNGQGALIDNKQAVRPTPATSGDMTCPKNYIKCGSGDLNSNDAICVPSTSVCPITFLGTEATLGDWQPPLQSSYFVPPAQQIESFVTGNFTASAFTTVAAAATTTKTTAATAAAATQATTQATTAAAAEVERELYYGSPSMFPTVATNLSDMHLFIDKKAALFKSLPAVELAMAFSQFTTQKEQERGPCLGSSGFAPGALESNYASLSKPFTMSTYSSNSILSYAPVNSAPGTCANSDPRYYLYDDQQETALLQENFLLSKQCAGMSIDEAIASDYFSLVNVGSNGVAGYDNRCIPPTSKDAVGVKPGFLCDTVQPASPLVSCLSGDYACQDAYYQSACGRLFRFSEFASTTPEIQIGLFLRPQIFWSDTCKVAMNQIVAAVAPLEFALYSQQAVLTTQLTNLVFTIFLLVALILFSIPWGNRDNMEENEARAERNFQASKWWLEVAEKLIGFVFSFVNVVVASIAFSAVEQLKTFYTSISNQNCSDRVTNETFGDVATYLPKVDKANRDVVILSSVTLVVFLGPVLFSIYKTCCGAKDDDDETNTSSVVDAIPSTINPVVFASSTSTGPPPPSSSSTSPSPPPPPPPPPPSGIVMGNIAKGQVIGVVQPSAPVIGRVIAVNSNV